MAVPELPVVSTLPLKRFINAVVQKSQWHESGKPLEETEAFDVSVFLVHLLGSRVNPCKVSAISYGQVWLVVVSYCRL